MIDITKLSGRFDVRRLGENDVERILALCRGHTLFYQYCEGKPTREQIVDDMTLTPPGIGPEDKYYVGFFQHDELIAVIDLIDGYPRPDIAFVGFFMVDPLLQGRGLGSELTQEVSAYLRSIGMTAIRLVIDKENPQSSHFWKKNGFEVIEERDRNGWTIFVAEKKL